MARGGRVWHGGWRCVLRVGCEEPWRAGSAGLGGTSLSAGAAVGAALVWCPGHSAQCKVGHVGHTWTRSVAELRV